MIHLPFALGKLIEVSGPGSGKFLVFHDRESRELPLFCFFILYQQINFVIGGVLETMGVIHPWIHIRVQFGIPTIVLLRLWVVMCSEILYIFVQHGVFVDDQIKVKEFLRNVDIEFESLEKVVAIFNEIELVVSQ